jgi:hypothetical protein
MRASQVVAGASLAFAVALGLASPSTASGQATSPISGPFTLVPDPAPGSNAVFCYAHGNRQVSIRYCCPPVRSCASHHRPPRNPRCPDPC